MRDKMGGWGTLSEWGEVLLNAVVGWVCRGTSDL